MKYLPSIITLIVVVAESLSPQLQELVSKNPVLVVVLGGVYAILKHMLPSPVAQKEKSE